MASTSSSLSARSFLSLRFSSSSHFSFAASDTSMPPFEVFFYEKVLKLLVYCCEKRYSSGPSGMDKKLFLSEGLERMSSCGLQERSQERSKDALYGMMET